MSVLVGCDAWLYNNGHTGIFFTHKTEAEKQIQQAQIERLRKDCKE